MTASQEMTCFLLFDKLCDYTVQNFVVGSSNNDDGTSTCRSRQKCVAVENDLKPLLAKFRISDFFFIINTIDCGAYRARLQGGLWN